MEVDLQARMLPTGTYSTQQDPRLNIELVRSTVGAGLASGLGLNLKMAQANLGYNVLLEAVEPRLRAATTYEQFKAVYEWLETVTELPLTKRQEGFLEDLGIGTTAPESTTLTISNDPESLLPEVSLPKPPVPGVGRQMTFLGKIRKNGGMVSIELADKNRLRADLDVFWAGQHQGQHDAIEWKARAAARRMKHLLSIVTLALLTGCFARSEGNMVNTYTRQELLYHLTASFAEKEGYKSVACDDFGGKEAVKACFLTNNPPVSTDHIIKNFQEQGLELSQDWMTIGSTTYKRLNYNGDSHYMVSFAFVPMTNSVNQIYKDSGFSNVLTIYLDKGY